jgi:predicted outer membrane repeat protein
MFYKNTHLLLFLLFFCLETFSATYYVRTSADGGNNANNGTSAGTAWLTVSYAVSTVASGDVIDIGAGTFVDSNITISTANITLDGAGNTSTIMDGSTLAGTNDRAFYITASGVTVKDMKIKSYNATSNTSPGAGGAGIRIRNINGSVTIQNVIFESNQTKYGGAIYVQNTDGNTSSVTLDACTFNSNSSNTGTSGGAIFTDTTSGSVNLTLNNATAVGTSGYPNTSVNNGGGIYFEGGTLTLNNASVRYNTSTLDGAGIYLMSGTANIDNATIANNTASDDGGGIYCASGSTLNVGQSAAVTFGGSGNGNTATGRGGAIFFNASVLNIDNTTISYNRAKKNALCGGGIYFWDVTTSANIDVSTISYNEGAETSGNAADGGGIAVSGGSVTCTRVAFYNNTCADNGSAIANNATLTLTNCLIYDNTAYNYGAIYGVSGSTTNITNCSIADNTENGPSSNCAGSACTGTGTTMTLKNTIVRGNANRDINQGTSATVNVDYCAYGSMSAIGGSNTNNITTDPLFTNSGANDFTLQSTSPCYDKATSVSAPTVDYNGTSRTKSACGGNGYDIGCYEGSTDVYQYYRSRATGNWNIGTSWDVSKDNSTWIDASTLPLAEYPCSGGNVITIQNTHTITLSTAESADQMTIVNGGTLTYSSGTLTIENGTGTDLTINGILTRSAANDIVNNGSIIVGATGTYKHNIAAASKNLPTATWNSGSTLEIQAVEDVAAAVIGGDNQSFQHITFNFNQATGTSYYVFGNSGTPTIGGNVTVSSTGSGAVYFGNATYPTITIGGGFTVSAGTAAISGVNSTTDAKTLQVNGNFSITGGALQIAKRTGGGGNGTFKLKGNFSMTGGSIEEGNSNTAALEFNQSTGAVQSITFSSATISGTIAFTVKANAVVDLGAAELTGSSTFTTESGASLKIGHANGITSSGASGNIQFSGSRTFNGGSNYEYNSSAANQSTGNGLPATLTANFKINNSFANATVTLSQATTLNGSLTLTLGDLVTTSSNLLTLGTAGTCSAGSASSYISGPLKKNFNSTSEFIFRNGKNADYAECSITPTSTNAESWTVEYFDVVGTNTGSKAAGVDHVSTTQYWQIDRTGTNADAQIKLYWTSASGAQGVTDYTKLLVCRYNGTQWEKAGGSSTASGSNSSGNVISGTVTSFSPFTLGSLDASNPLPVELIFFSAEAKDESVELNWETASEINNNYFTIERSVDAINFEVIATLNGSGNTTTRSKYQYHDYNPLEGTSYYRLKQTDYNGSWQIAGQTVAVQFNTKNNNSIYVYPSPCSMKENIIVSIFENEICEMATIKLCDSEGKTVYQNLIDLSQCANSNFDLNLSSVENKLSLGLYKLLIYTGSKIYSTSLVLHN